MQTLFRRPDQLPHKLYVITPIFNPVRYRTRWKLYEDFAKMCAEAGAELITVEVAYGDRAFVIPTDGPCGRVIQLRTQHELWLKENAINVGVQHLPRIDPQWSRVAWVDADVLPARQDWVNETLHALERYAFVQMWGEYADLDSHCEMVHPRPGKSFMWNYLHGKHEQGDGGYYSRRGYPGAPGLAWACTRDAWDTVGGLMDIGILGAGDWYMAHALLGKLDLVVNSQRHPEYNRAMYEWQERAEALHHNVGYVPGLYLHYWHGPKIQRKYGSREQILVNRQFNPRTDITRDWQGLMQLRVFDERTRGLRDDVRRYFAERNEDQLSQ